MTSTPANMTPNATNASSESNGSEASSDASFKTAENDETVAEHPPAGGKTKLDQLLDFMKEIKAEKAKNSEAIKELKTKTTGNDKALANLKLVTETLKINSQITWQQTSELANQVFNTHTFVENKTDEITKDVQETLREQRNLVLWELKLDKLEEFREGDEPDAEVVSKFAFEMVNSRLKYIEAMDLKSKRIQDRDGDNPGDFRMMISFTCAGDANKMKIRLNNEGFITCRLGMSKMTRKLCTKYKVLADTMNKENNDPGIEYRTKYQFSIAGCEPGNPDNILSLDSSMNPSEPYRKPKLRVAELVEYPAAAAQAGQAGQGDVEAMDEGEVVVLDDSQAAETNKRKRSETNDQVEENPQTKRLRNLASQDVRFHVPPPNRGMPRPPHPGYHHGPRPWRGRGYGNQAPYRQPYSDYYQQGPRGGRGRGQGQGRRGRPPGKKHPYSSIAQYYSTNRTQAPYRNNSFTPRNQQLATSAPRYPAPTLATTSAQDTPENVGSTEPNSGSDSAMNPLARLTQGELAKVKQVPVSYVSFDKETMQDALKGVNRRDMAIKIYSTNQELLEMRQKHAQLQRELAHAKQVLQAPASAPFQG